MTRAFITRPKAPTKKIRTSDSFELCYLRHQYFRRVKYNPTEADMLPYMKIVEHLTRNTFLVYMNLFKAVGLQRDDVLNIGRVHLVSFLGLYALEKMKNKKKEYSVKFLINNKKEPEQKDFDQKNKANFTLFFKQRMEDLVRVCRQKVRNINGYPSEEYVIFCGKETPPKQISRLLKNYGDLGYKKVDFSIFKSIRRKAKVNNDATVFKFDDMWYIAIATEQKKITVEDIMGSEANPYSNYHNMQPDDIYIQNESEKLYSLFDMKDSNKKEKILRKFIAKNRLNGQYKEEVSTARKLLKALGI